MATGAYKNHRRFQAGIIVDLRVPIESIIKDRALWLVRDIFDIEEIVESLIEEPAVPREYPDIMDMVSDRVDKSKELQGLVDHSTLEVMSMMLEVHQQSLDQEILRFLSPSIESISYEVTRWLNPTTVVISVNPDTNYKR